MRDSQKQESFWGGQAWGCRMSDAVGGYESTTQTKNKKTQTKNKKKRSKRFDDIPRDEFRDDDHISIRMINSGVATEVSDITFNGGRSKWSLFSCAPSSEPISQPKSDRLVNEERKESDTKSPYASMLFSYLYGSNDEDAKSVLGEERRDDIEVDEIIIEKQVLPPPVFFELHDIPNPPSECDLLHDETWLPRSPSLIYDYQFPLHLVTAKWC